MITAKLQIILFIASILTFLSIINMIRKYNLELKYSLLWLFFCIVNVFLASFSQFSIGIAEILSIKEPVNAIFLLSFVFLFFIIFSLTLTISKLSGKLSQLVQEIAIIKKELETDRGNKASK
ncbi:DUF2304 domain-containing protein [Robertmurraya yapensis]|uniref:DUF2304 domain-containing protein n=1 Tax=Bacillus yapensis TaxID=2492960 RepID=A0A3S0LIQ7_9BACI|nr:DUF2304 domain-containing protein [Bacillus yapensis]RTR36416.1 DUF2304 domain-containing protein [Bacillus yapensis]TKT05920.1 DUF2304 family protein [Bacillus yapensis]